MLHVTCPRPCCPAVFGRVAFYRWGPRKRALPGSCAQRLRQTTCALPSYQHVLKERLVQDLRGLAKGSSKRGIPAYILKENRRQGEVLIKKLLPKGSNVEDTYLSTWQIAESVHALSVLGSHEYFEWEMELLLQVAARRSEQFSPEWTIRLLYCAAKALHYSPALNTLAISARLLDGLPAMRSRDVGQLLWALATLHLKPRALLERLEATMDATGMTHKPVPTAVGDTSGRDLLHYCWALAVLEQTGSEAFQIPWRALLQKQPEGNGTLATDATVFCQVIEELRTAGQGRRISAGHLALYERYLKVWTDVLQTEERLVSSLHRDVMRALELSSTEYEEEAIIGIYSVDIALPDYKVAIEVDGPTHFTRMRPRRPLGQTLMKHRHLEGAGWVVISVSSDDWYAQASWQQKMYLLRDLFYSIEKQQLEAGA